MNAAAPKCKAAFSLAQQVLPSQKELDGFKQRATAIKAQFSNNAKKLICDADQGKFIEAVNKWEASLPLSKEQHLANMKNSLNSNLEKAAKWKTRNAKIDSSPKKDVFYAIDMASLREDYNDNNTGANQVCENFMTNIVPDATAYFSNNFVIGPLVINQNNLDGITHHELGHKLFHYIKGQSTCDKTWFGKVRACLLSNHTELTGEEMTEQLKQGLAGDSKYESEDFADLVSSMIDNKSSNFACVFVRKLNTEDYKGMSLRYDSDTDPHSSDFFRLLHMNFLKTGKTPEICLQAMGSKGQTVNFKNCTNP